MQLPTPETDGRVQTLNKRGAASPEIDEAAQGFLEYSKNVHKVLEIGGAYGSLMLKAFSYNPQILYTLNDIDARHLFIAAKRLEDEIAKGGITKNVTRQVDFVAEDITLSNLKYLKGDYDAIFIGRVLHFFNPKQLKQSIANLHLLLKPKGRIYAIAITPYVKRYEAFIAAYEKRVLAGDKFPGYVTNLKHYVNNKVTTSNQISNILDQQFMFMDVNVMTRLFQDAGFQVLVTAT